MYEKKRELFLKLKSLDYYYLLIIVLVFRDNYKYHILQYFDMKEVIERD